MAQDCTSLEEALQKLVEPEVMLDCLPVGFLDVRSLQNIGAKNWHF